MESVYKNIERNDSDIDSDEEESKEDPTRDQQEMKKKTAILWNVRALIPPPNPLLPKSFVSSLDEPIRPGGYIKFIALKQFKGQDLPCDIGDENTSESVPKVEYPPSSTLKDIFDFRDALNNKKIVYMRSTK